MRSHIVHYHIGVPQEYIVHFGCESGNEKLVAVSVRSHHGYLLKGTSRDACSVKGQFDEMSDSRLFAGFEKVGKVLLPVLKVSDGAEDGFDAA